MSDTLLWIALAGGELLLIIFIALFVSWLRNRLMRRRDRKAIAALVEHSRGHKDERMAEIGSFLGEKYALEGDAHGYAVRALYKAEARLIQTFARTYLQRDARAASRFSKPVEDSMGEYWSLEAGVGHADFANAEAAAEQEAAAAGVAATEEGQQMVDTGELEKLRKENATLSDELRLAMDTMGRMLNEYSNVFAKDADLGNIQVIDGEPTLDDLSEALTEESPDDDAMAEVSADAAAVAGEEPVEASEAALGEMADTEALDEAIAAMDTEDMPEAVAEALAEPEVEPDAQPAASSEAEPTSEASGENVFDQAEAVLSKADALLREMETDELAAGDAAADVESEAGSGAVDGEAESPEDAALDDAEIDDLLSKLDKEP